MAQATKFEVSTGFDSEIEDREVIIVTADVVGIDDTNKFTVEIYNGKITALVNYWGNLDFDEVIKANKQLCAEMIDIATEHKRAQFLSLLAKREKIEQVIKGA
jgi:hypothetical protein